MSNMSFPCIHYLLYFDIGYIYSWNDTPSFTLRAYFPIQLNAMGKQLSMFLHLAPSLFINLPHPHAHISLRVANLIDSTRMDPLSNITIYYTWTKLTEC